jgi:hypothetical protein
MCVVEYELNDFGEKNTHNPMRNGLDMRSAGSQTDVTPFAKNMKLLQ